MSISLKREFVVFAALLAVGVVLRLVPHPANVTPVFAAAIFGGAVLSNRSAFLLPIFTLVLSDLFLGWYTPGVLASVYGSALVAVYLGTRLRNIQSRGEVSVSAIVSSLFFFVVSNFAVWLFTPLYPQTVTGLVAAYVAALPFLRNELVGTLVYALTFFELAKLWTLYRPHNKFFVSCLTG